MDKESFKELMSELDGLNRHQIEAVINECISCFMEMLPKKEEGGF